MIKKQKKIIFIALAAIVLLAVIYAVLANTVLKPDPEPTGEGVDLRLFERIETDDLESIVVKNANGSFRYYRGVDSQLYLEGAEALIYDSYMTSLLTSYSRSAVASRVVEGYDASAISVYGLAEGSENAVVTVSSSDGVSRTIRLGAKLVDSSGYYAMVAGSDTLYVLDSYYGAVFCADIRDFIAPQVANPISSGPKGIALNDYVMREWGQTVVRIEPAPETETDLMLGAVSGYVITEPESRPANDFSIALLLGGSSSEDEKKTIGLNAMAGTRVVEYSVNSSVEALRKYVGTEDRDAAAAYREEASAALGMFMKYSLIDVDTGTFAKEIEYTCSDDYNYLIVGSVGQDGNFYVYSQAYDVIVEFPAEQVEWLFWDLDNFSLKSLFSAYVYDVDEFEITSPSVSALFKVEARTGDTASIVSVTDTLSSTEVDQALFKQLYRCFLQFDSVGAIEPEEGSELLLSVRVLLKDGAQTVFSFYDTDGARKSWYTVDGVVSNYYVNRDYVKDLISYTGMTLRGESFTARVR
ncbi:MAG: DUF4340 domain-containing protein [Clostridia bacterium]|nr:DUF4340 domain-containing protein [Clostridia bacterium]